MQDNWLKSRFIEPAVFIFIFIILVILAFNLNFPSGKAKMGGEFWSDKGGYYVYLPALFIYHFDASKFPDSIDHKTSNGFSLDLINNKIFTKYPCGIALLVAPFFLTTHFIADISGLNANGFGIIYQWSVVIAGVFYLTLGLWFLKKFLDHYFRSWISYLTLLFLLTGTNLYFYGLDDVLMSHIYSFFLLSVFLFLLKKIAKGPKKRSIHLIQPAIIFALAILVRPTNVLFFLIYLFFESRSFKEIKDRIITLVQPCHFVTFLLITFLILLPQMLYWKYAYGSFIHYSYTGEGFTNLIHPRIFEIWFSPLNGLFIYNPAVLFMLAGIVIMVRNKVSNGMFILFFFLFISYLFSSWCIWYFGGCHGSRPFVDFYPLLCLPFGFFLDFIYSRGKKILSFIITAFIILFSFYNLKLIYNFQVFTGSTWGWHDFLQTLDRAGLYNLERKRYVYRNDFENITVNNGIPTTTENYRSGNRSTFMIEDMVYNCGYSKGVNNIIRHKMVRKVNLSVWINPRDTDKTGALIVFKISDSPGNPAFSRMIRVDDFPTRKGKWTEIKGTFDVPPGIDPKADFNFYIWNYGKKRFYIDDQELIFN